MSRRIGFDIDGFHGRGDGTVVELEDILEAAASRDFIVERIWIAPELHKQLIAAIFWDPEVKPFEVSRENQGNLMAGPVTSSYRCALYSEPIPFFLDPDVRGNRLVLEGQHAIRRAG